ncbi:hypothetical protein BC829DRAFT_403109 [Chytridium lagenaria]|nr:hypothetical protein BC829DRAFT_403109 [Chytridium lagenaria]
MRLRHSEGRNVWKTVGWVFLLSSYVWTKCVMVGVRSRSRMWCPDALESRRVLGIIGSETLLPKACFPWTGMAASLEEKKHTWGCSVALP